MTTTRIVLAGLLGGIAMFIWSSIAHMVLPLGHAGIRELPNEEPLLAQLQIGLGNKSGLYLFPGLGVGDNPTREQEKEAMTHYAEKLANNPSGILMYHPAGTRPLTFGKLLTVEFATEFLEATGRNRNQCFLLELVRVSRRLHQRLHVYADCRLPLCRSRRRARLTKERT